MDSIFTSELGGGAYILVKQGLVDDVGCVFTSLTGYQKSDFYQKKISEVIHHLFGFDLDVDNPLKPDHFLFKKSKEAIEVHISTCPIGKDNQIFYLFQQKANFILNSELSLVNKLMNDNYAGVGLYSCPDFRLLKANHSYLNHLRDSFRNEENLIGLRRCEFISDYCGSNAEKIWQSINETGQTVRLNEQKSLSRDGVIRYWNETITPLSEGGKVKYLVTVLDDITETIQKRKSLEEKNKELELKIELKDEMLILISHELKTPLSIITSSIQTVEIVCGNELTEKVKKYLNKIKLNAYRQMKLVNNILDNTRMNSGFFKINSASVDIVLLTKTIIDSISVFAERKGVKISFRAESEQSVIYTDADIYERILLNLLSNAVKFTPKGNSIEVSVSQVLSKSGQQVCIQVKDSGIGIPNDQKDLIFERFGRVSRIVTRHSEGTGIGLYLVKTLVALLNGEIKVESKEGVGSSFFLMLPSGHSYKNLSETAGAESVNEQLVAATDIEFSDIYFGT